MNAVFCAVFSFVFLVVFCTTRRYSMHAVFYEYSHTYSFGFSCILDEVKKYTDFAYFLAGGWEGGGSDPRIPYSGVRREYMVFSVFWPYSVRILPNHRIRRIRTEYGPCILVDRIPRILYVFCVFSSGGQNTVFCQKNRIRTEYGQNTDRIP